MSEQLGYSVSIAAKLRVSGSSVATSGLCCHLIIAVEVVADQDLLLRVIWTPVSAILLERGSLTADCLMKSHYSRNNRNTSNIACGALRCH